MAAKKTRKVTTGTVPGRLGDRAARTLKRRAKAIDQYIEKGMSREDAAKRVDKEMRENARGDWRAG